MKFFAFACFIAMLAVSAAATQQNSVESNLNSYVSSYSLSCLLIMLSFLVIVAFGALMLWDLQTPTMFVNQSINFGKIEK